MQRPSEEDNCSLQERILGALREQGMEESVRMGAKQLQKAGELCELQDWCLTVLLGYDGYCWNLLSVEAGDTTERHYGLSVDLGSTTIAMELVDMNTGELMVSGSIFNPQIVYGEDILTRIFYTKDHPERRQELQSATVQGFVQLMDRLTKEAGVDRGDCTSMVVAGNTTMIHFLLGLDAFAVFQSPYAVYTLKPDAMRGGELGIPITGYLYCYPAMANYLGGDIVSGIIATGISEREEISVFLDIGTNGELVVGSRDFLLAGAGAAGPALEGGVVRTGMRAEMGAVDRVVTEQGGLKVHVIGDAAPEGICGSGIVDLLAELYLNGWIDIRGQIQEEGSLAVHTEEGLAIEYAPGLYFYQRDIDEFLTTKAAANTMVEYMMNLIGLTMDDIGRFYVAGAFGTHINKESGVTIGLYPDMDREKILSPGNTSLAGARRMLLDRSNRERAEEILSRMEYVQFGAVEDFVHRMAAARAIPHTELERYPSVLKRLQSRLGLEN
jgi:uncharacterized 2Fe-2S/4Fe-4S cluster protein (DUF4445 family)